MRIISYGLSLKQGRLLFFPTSRTRYLYRVARGMDSREMRGVIITGFIPAVISVKESLTMSGNPLRLLDSGAAAKAGADPVLASRPDPEVVAKPKRRTYTAEYKQRILAEAEAAAALPG